MTQILLLIASTLVGSLISYLVARRKHSGKINTTEAETLWLEADKIRQEYREEVERLRIELKERRKVQNGRS